MGGELSFLWLAAAAFLAGVLGALTGLGGGVVLVPMLLLLFKVDLHYAIGARAAVFGVLGIALAA